MWGVFLFVDGAVGLGEGVADGLGLLGEKFRGFFGNGDGIRCSSAEVDDVKCRFAVHKEEVEAVGFCLLEGAEFLCDAVGALFVHFGVGEEVETVDLAMAVVFVELCQLTGETGDDLFLFGNGMGAVVQQCP